VVTNSINLSTYICVCVLLDIFVSFTFVICVCMSHVADEHSALSCDLRWHVEALSYDL